MGEKHMDYGGAEQPWQRPGKGLWGQGTVAQLLLFCGDRPPIFTIPRFTGDAGRAHWRVTIFQSHISLSFVGTPVSHTEAAVR